MKYIIQIKVYKEDKVQKNYVTDLNCDELLTLGNLKTKIKSENTLNGDIEKETFWFRSNKIEDDNLIVEQKSGYQYDIHLKNDNTKR